MVRKDFCGDLMFSGHTFQFAIGCIYIYLLYPNIWIKIIGTLATIIYGILVSVSRLHYTIDIIVAIITALLVHQNVEYYYNKWLIRSNVIDNERSLS
jgi:membrane protein DedA with SNARE-associated domain